MMGIDRSQRIFGLDILRASAIFFVMMVHAGAFVPRNKVGFYSTFILDGVGVFFVLSGFLIGSIFIKQMEKNGLSLSEIMDFWMKRWTRTLPNYFIVLLGLSLFYVLFEPFDRHFFTYYFFSQNLFTKTNLSFFEWSWSIAVEEWFYLLFPVLVFFIYKFRFSLKHTILTSAILGLLIVNFSKLNYLTHHPNFSYIDLENITYSVFYRLDGIMMGILTAYVAFYYPMFFKKYKKIWFSFGVILLLFYLYMSKINDLPGYWDEVFGLTLFSLIVAFILPLLSQIKNTTKEWVYVPITFLSVISYSLYLLNSVISNSMRKMISISEKLASENNFQIPWALFFIFSYLLFWVLSIYISYLFYKKVEMPLISFFRKKYIKK